MTDRRCPQCGHNNAPDATFCSECGQPLASGRPCSSCGFTGNPETAAYCVQCGAALGRRQSLSPFIWLGGLVVLLLVAGGVLWQTGLAARWAANSSLPMVRPSATAGAASLEEDTAGVTDNTPTALPAADTPAPSRTPTHAATATSTPTPTPTPSPSATPQPSATSSPTHTPAPTPCGTAVLGAFAQVWQVHAEALGCPSSAGHSEVWIADETFQRGRMFWREDNRRIYVLYNNGRWESYADTWYEGDPEYTCGTKQHPPTPIRGFGKVWCTYDNVRQGLGDAMGIEWGDYGAVQGFGEGLLLRTGGGSVFVLYSDGTWRQ